MFRTSPALLVRGSRIYQLILVVPRGKDFTATTGFFQSFIGVWIGFYQSQMKDEGYRIIYLGDDGCRALLMFVQQ